jgi:predicted O-methyltransferase YrrM
LDSPPVPPHPPATTRIRSLSRAEFAARFGNPHLGGALCGYTREADTRAVLSLLAHARPRRVLEVGTALGHMTANLTHWTPENACIFTIDIVRGMARAAASASEQQGGKSVSLLFSRGS